MKTKTWKEIKILVGCEHSGAVRDAFIKNGFNAVSCDFLYTQSPGPHIADDIISVLQSNKNFDVLIAFPPCTYLSDAAARYRSDIFRFRKMIVAMELFYKLYNSGIEHVAIENPKGILSTAFRNPDQIINPYYWGSEYRKRTCLWLQNLPKLFWSEQTDMFALKTFDRVPETNYVVKNKKGKTKKQTYNDCRTFPEVAAAMADQWGFFLKQKYPA